MSYAEMCHHPEVFRDLTGMTREEFDALALEFATAELARRDASANTAEGEPRRNAAGAGRPHSNDAQTRLLMALFWLRAYPTYAVLGFFFGLHKRNAQLNARSALGVLDSLGTFRLDRPAADRPKANSAAKVMAAFPAVRVIIDGKEQRCNKPKGEAAQKPYYSGKKKCHTIKTQVVVDTCGEIEGVSESVPGGANHDITLLRESGALDELEEGEAAMLDKGYTGIDKTHPDVPVVIPFKKPRGKELTQEQRGHNREVARHRVVVEHTMAQLNRFTVLRQTFRGQKRGRHSEVVRVVAKLVNRRLRVRPLKVYKAA